MRDNVRPNARQAIAALHKGGVQKVVMLTGDNERTAQAIAREVGIDEVYADLKPEDKSITFKTSMGPVEISVNPSTVGKMVFYIESTNEVKSN